ncbi:MAG: D-glycerate dehydrogenase [Phycisphaeraceae bacterium]|nr:D-glycerate dehydrogenase [Phycisphaeraceae bacterium]
MPLPPRPRVLFACYYDRDVIGAPLERLRGIAEISEVNHGRNLTADELREHLPGKHFVVAADEKHTSEILDTADEVILLARDGTGYDGIDVDAATARGILVTNAPVVHEATADLTIGLIIGLVRRIVLCDRDVRDGRWTERERRTCPALTDLTLGIVGFGLTGREVAIRAAALGMRVVVHNRSDVADAIRAVGAEPVSLDDVLAESDVLSVHVRHTKATTHMFDRALLRRMKRGAYFINTSRGGILDETALVEALQDGHLAGAALDVFAEEPLPTDHPLLSFENVICTAHIGGETTTTMRLGVERAVDDIERLVRGERPKHLVNPEAWETARARR